MKHRMRKTYLNNSSSTGEKKSSTSLLVGMLILLTSLTFVIVWTEYSVQESHRKFSPWNMCDVREFKTNWGSTQQVFNLYGINVIDYLELYKKHTFVNQESYRLDHIANVELGKSKISYEEEGSLHHLYRNNYSKFLAYNVKDVTLVEDLEEKLGLMELILAMSYNAKCNYNDTFGMVKYWETIIYNFLKEQKIATPPQKLSTNKR